MKNIKDLEDDDFTESMQGNEEGEMGIPCTNLNMEAATIKMLMMEIFRKQRTQWLHIPKILFIFFTQHTIGLCQVALKKKV